MSARPQPPAPAAPVRALSLALLAVAVFAAFAGVTRNGWILFDDPHYVYENPYVARGWTAEGVRWSLAEPHGANWHPLTSWSHMLDVELFGLRPGAHHAVSLLLHVVNAVLLVLVLRGLTGAWWRSLLVGALFALHPLRVESVAWVSERKDVLSGLFFLLTLAAYGSWARRGGAGRYALVAACLALGLMAKPMLVTVPFLLLLLDVWPLGRLRPGNQVNLERAMQLGDRLGGHLVTGHIDCVGTLRKLEQVGGSTRLEVGLPAEQLRYVVEKGSVALNGISLTVNWVGPESFSLNIIPHTMDATTLHLAKQGDSVNIETDLIGKYVARLLNRDEDGPGPSKGLSAADMKRMGW